MDLRLPLLLDRRFEAVIFDWDGTAVPDRSADASELRALVEELCALGLDMVVVTGTHVGNVGGQLGARPAGPGHLYFCVNRGSEVYAANPDGIELVDRQQATPAEDDALDAAAAETVAELGRRGACLPQAARPWRQKGEKETRSEAPAVVVGDSSIERNIHDVQVGCCRRHDRSDLCR